MISAVFPWFMPNNVYDGSGNLVKVSNAVVIRCLVCPAQSLKQGRDSEDRRPFHPGFSRQQSPR